MPYTVIESQLKNPVLMQARRLARGICQQNGSLLEEGNDFRPYKEYFEIICSDQGYPFIHDIIFSTLENQSDLPESRYYKGLYSALLKENITFDTLKHLLSDNAEQTSIESLEPPLSDSTEKTSIENNEHLLSDNAEQTSIESLEPPLSDSTEKTSIENNEHLLSYKAEKTSMALPFFRALDPTSKKSGITYCLAYGSVHQNTEMLDVTVGESIADAFNHNLDFLFGLNATYNIIVGTHYDLYVTGQGKKGMLDYLILPLVARKLIADSYLDERKNSVLVNILAWTVATPIECARFTAAFALTLLLAPIVALVHLVKACMPKEAMYELDMNAAAHTPSF
jgi:hypothetical protein